MGENFFAGHALIEESGECPLCLHGINSATFKEFSSFWKLAEDVAEMFGSSWNYYVSFELPEKELPEEPYERNELHYELTALSPSLIKQFSFVVNERVKSQIPH